MLDDNDERIDWTAIVLSDGKRVDLVAPQETLHNLRRQIQRLTKAIETIDTIVDPLTEPMENAGQDVPGILLTLGEQASQLKEQARLRIAAVQELLTAVDERHKKVLAAGEEERQQYLEKRRLRREQEKTATPDPNKKKSLARNSG
jgi:flagellar motility protein MotE (MotC chaperone)